jgi:hypothetical protein
MLSRKRSIGGQRSGVQIVKEAQIDKDLRRIEISSTRFCFIIPQMRKGRSCPQSPYPVCPMVDSGPTSPFPSLHLPQTSLGDPRCGVTIEDYRIVARLKVVGACR